MVYCQTLSRVANATCQPAHNTAHLCTYMYMYLYAPWADMITVCMLFHALQYPHTHTPSTPGQLWLSVCSRYSVRFLPHAMPLLHFKSRRSHTRASSEPTAYNLYNPQRKLVCTPHSGTHHTPHDPPCYCSHFLKLHIIQYFSTSSQL